MAKNKTGRNDPCPCGSKKKYKRCCLRRIEQEQHTRQQASPVDAPDLVLEEDDLDKFSNRVVHLINANLFDEAETACHELRQRYPEMHDWIDRTAMLHEARGDHALAADFYRRTLAYMEDPANVDGFDEDGRQYYRDKIRQMQQLADQPSS